MKFVSPSIKETAYNCPHCRALTQQSFYSARVDKLRKNDLPVIIDDRKLNTARNDYTNEKAVSDELMNWIEEMHVSGAPTPSGFQREIGVKAQGSSRSMSEAGWPAAMASSVVFR